MKTKTLQFSTMDEAENHFTQQGFSVAGKALTNRTMTRRDGKKFSQVFINRKSPGDVSATVEKFNN